jgi:hypothetical protein
MCPEWTRESRWARQDSHLRPTARVKWAPKILARVDRLRGAGPSLAEIEDMLGVSKSMAAKLIRKAAA